MSGARVVPSDRRPARWSLLDAVKEMERRQEQKMDENEEDAEDDL
jgi:hypothetical protein